MLSIIIVIASKVFGALLVILKMLIKLVIAAGKAIISLIKAIASKINNKPKAKGG